VTSGVRHVSDTGSGLAPDALGYNHGMFRRLLAALLACTTALAVAWPAHARMAADSVAGPWDRCLGGKIVPATPAGEVGTHADCDRCCASGAAPPPELRDRTPMPEADRDARARTTRVDAILPLALSPPARAPPRD
jgi:hypothetical protein